MATNYPTGLDSYTTKTDNVDSVFAAHVNDLQSAVAALEAKIGVDSSAVNTTLDYFLKNASGAFRTHTHDGSSDDGPNIPTTNLSGVLTIAQLPVDAVLQEVYPVGSIYIETTGTNPNTTFGFGTWVAFGAGRVPVGYDSGDSDFDTAEETGGAKTHTLTEDEMPSHTHQIYFDSSGSTYTVGSAAGAKNTIQSGSAGGDAAHNNLQPYIVVHMWKRTA